MASIETLQKDIESWLKLTIKIPERSQWRGSDIFIGNFEQS